MKSLITHAFRLIGVLAVLALISVPAFAQTAPANNVAGYPGAGVLQNGDLWDSYLPQGFGPFYSEGGTAATEGIRQFIRMGNFDRSWTTPGAHWPNAFDWTMFWDHKIVAQCFDPDANFNSTKKGEAAPVTGNYAQVTFKNNLPGASDPNRYYSREPYFVDGAKRQHAVYEAAWPTNVGLDVKFRAHSLSGPNWGHFNDFIIMEIEFKNTGVRDMNLDGVADDLAGLSPDIKALTLLMGGECYMSISSLTYGGRSRQSISNKFTRMGGWIDDPDPDGNPWAFAAYYPGAKDAAPAAGARNFGMNAPTFGWYTDIWDGWTWIDVKNGGLPADASRTTATLPSAQTIFGTHAVGEGPQRGWYVSAGSGGGLGVSYTNPRQEFQIAAGTWLKNGGVSRAIAQLDAGPDENFFQSGTAGDVTSFVPKAAPERPRGDQKILGTFDQVLFEDGTGYPTGWGKWTQGYNFGHDFNGDLYTGIGPINIPVGESRTFVLAMVAGYRLEGIQKAVRAARYTYANDYTVVPALPPVPDVKVSNTLTKTVNVEWNNVAEQDPEFAGYKVWKSSNFLKKKWLEEGIRLSDRYQEQMTPGEDKNPFKKPVNPKFDAFTEVNSTSTKGEYQPDTWGTWELVKTIPKAQLAQVAGAGPGYNYKYEDQDVVLGFSYWYYVSAYKEGSYTGPGGETTTRIETTPINRNGADGLWHRTYPYAPLNANFPKDVATKKAIGAVQVVYSALAPAGDVAKVGVRPNPYKRAALHDNFANVFDHKLLFYNLPPQCKITILDVAGQIVDEINFTSNDPNLGSVFWDMFSKDGIEVASGLYVYVVESPTGGQKTGYFSILR